MLPYARRFLADPQCPSELHGHQGKGTGVWSTSVISAHADHSYCSNLKDWYSEDTLGVLELFIP